MSAILRHTCKKYSPRIINVTKRCISTSEKNKDTVSVTAPAKTIPETKHKNWQSYGFEIKDKESDRNATHSVLFVTITVCLIGCSYVWGYAPDYKLRDWAQREAYIELRRREMNGLPQVDPNLIDPTKIRLPTDEELGDTEIII